MFCRGGIDFNVIPLDISDADRRWGKYAAASGVPYSQFNARVGAVTRAGVIEFGLRPTYVQNSPFQAAAEGIIAATEMFWANVLGTRIRQRVLCTRTRQHVLAHFHLFIHLLQHFHSFILHLLPFIQSA